MREPTIQERVIALVGRPSHVEAARLWGRKSGLRAAAHALAGGRCLPELPPADEDLSLRNDEARRARIRTLAERPASKNRGVTRSAKRVPTTSTLNQRVQDDAAI